MASFSTAAAVPDDLTLPAERPQPRRRRRARHGGRRGRLRRPRRRPLAHLPLPAPRPPGIRAPSSRAGPSGGRTESTTRRSMPAPRRCPAPTTSPPSPRPRPTTSASIATSSRPSWEREGEILDFTITADTFMRNMVRILVGTMLEARQRPPHTRELRPASRRRPPLQPPEKQPPRTAYTCNQSATPEPTQLRPSSQIRLRRIARAGCGRRAGGLPDRRILKSAH